MEFLTLAFVALFGVTFLLYYARTNRTWQHAVLLLASGTFIAWYHWEYLAVALGITLFTFVLGHALHRRLDTPRAPLLLWTGIGGLVGFWILSRYWTGMFPLGISFYTFQALAYLIEIYWEEDPEDDLLDFTLYMLLFMKFLSGPIERGQHLLPQLKTAKTFQYTEVTRGMKLLAWGCFLKLVIADRIGPLLDTVFDRVGEASGIQLLLATGLYPIQLYADFAGYTCMAIGLGRMMGFQLSPNFDRPFIAESTGELWRRWHISLSSWVRDYVFTPLNASLRGIGRAGLNLSLLATFVVIGVWHGAGWTFALYGLFQGVLVVWETALKTRRDRIAERMGKRLWHLIMVMRTYVFFALSLLFFRLSSVSEVGHVYEHLFDGFRTNIKELRLGMTDHLWIVFSIAVVLMFVIEWINSRTDLILWSERQKPAVRWTVYFLLVLLIFFYGSFGVENFIYVQF
ncbi:MAG: MBOAT family protein [Prevotella sp.]|nr:MBOAT family protein [Prevotella sp.]